MKSPPRSSLRGLRTFCVAARYQSFKTAASELFVTASAVSQQVKSLEEELGLRLFERSAREVVLTEDGRALYEALRPLLEQLDALVADFRKAGRRKSVRISVQPFFASEFFVPRLSEFTARHPEIDIQVGTSDEASEKLPAEADLSIRLFSKAPAGTRADLLFPLRMVPAGSAAFRKTVKVKDKRIVSDFPLIVHDTRPKAWKEWSNSTGIALPEDARVTRLDSMIAVVRAAEQGIGAALVPVPIAEQWFKQRTIVRLFEDELVADVSYYLVSQDERSANPAVDTLRSWILERFAAKP
ncbi:MAG: LysR family transcriptional regulator [Woeseiaceae bacterium]|nr:LysR family transcriptional regulator [Gammaproteobacteria bacterium]NNF50678.1 LysR family transcriptional regulator [Woeseiaceae bacterium]NNK25535.1 LysR family transcriptional regulator [Woeseiaceae bacterium]